MTTGGNGQVGYKLVISGVVQDAINKLVNECNLLGIGPQVELALRKIFTRLKRDPLEFGELESRLKTLDLLVHVAVVSPLVVRFGIHQDQRLVFVQRIFLLD